MTAPRCLVLDGDMAKKTTTPSPEVVAAARDLLRAIKLATTLPDLERALRALPGAGDAGIHAMTELKVHNLPMRKGTQPHLDAIAWTTSEMLAAGEGGLTDQRCGVLGLLPPEHVTDALE